MFLSILSLLSFGRFPTLTDFLSLLVRFSQENKGGINPYHFMPFGHGPRNCVGMRFALVEAKTTLVKLIHRFKFERTEETEVRLFIYGLLCDLHAADIQS